MSLSQRKQVQAEHILSPCPCPRRTPEFVELPMNMYRTDKRKPLGQDYAFQIPETFVLEEDEGTRRIQQPDYLDVTEYFTISYAVHSHIFAVEAYILRHDRSDASTPSFVERVDRFWLREEVASVSNDSRMLVGVTASSAVISYKLRRSSRVCVRRLLSPVYSGISLPPKACSQISMRISTGNSKIVRPETRGREVSRPWKSDSLRSRGFEDVMGRLVRY